MAPDLSRVTLCCIDCVAHAAAARAIERSVAGCSFGAIRFLSDQPGPRLPAVVEFIPIPRISSAAEYSLFVLRELYRYIDTEYVLLIQWDGFVTHPEAWNPHFLDYDYIGAVWPQFADRKVGNGGFSLRSRRLLLATLDVQMNLSTAEDTCICRDNQGFLESRYGIRFAPTDVAEQFSYEWTAPHETFGFHGLHNLARNLAVGDVDEIWAIIPPDFLGDPKIIWAARWLIEAGRLEDAHDFLVRLARIHNAHPIPDLLKLTERMLLQNQ